MVLEERERGAQHAFDLRPALARSFDRVVDELRPVGERREEHGAVERFLRGEVVQQARPADTDFVGDIVQARAREAVIGEAPERDLENDVPFVDPEPAGSATSSWLPTLCLPTGR